ncbi:DNA polymerase III subunit gamma and tau [Agromyces sp. SYSU T00194]|uniref:DNA polymerase III subunit gamma and tau n=1 Tax=Agromyces chitinivorans TaxID=3158560 RepID=UPI0033908BA2
MVTALYRRYRPETFAEMIGQSQVTEPLMTALRADRVNHAYLFSGPRGCGKTTSARILARCLNCAEGPTDTPCGTCPSCVELSRSGGGSLDVVEIDAASHNGVDDARDLRERAVFAPARDRYKIFILDEAHMVTPQGFNALLKLVEEPPEHVKFIFATTEPEKVLGTIRSRTHHYPFRLVPPGPMLEYVQQLAESEHVQVDAGVLPLVVRAGGGSPRDTLSLLDQLIAGSEGDRVDYERAVALLGFTHGALLDEVVDAIGARDAAAAFAAVDRVIQTGQDPRRFVEDLLERLRDLIVVAASTPEAAAAVLRGIPEDEIAQMGRQAAAFGQAELSRTADIVNAALTEMTGATSPRLHLELMLARTLVPSSDDSSRGALARVERLERRVGVTDAPGGDAPVAAMPTAAAPAAAPPVAARPAATAPATPERAAGPAVADPAAASSAPAGPKTAAQPAAAEPPTPAPAPKPTGPVTVQQIRDAWPEVLSAVQAVRRSAWMVLFTAQVREFRDGRVLVLGFPSQSDVEQLKQQAAPGQGVGDLLKRAVHDQLGVEVALIARVDGADDAAPARDAGRPAGDRGSAAAPGTDSAEPAASGPRDAEPAGARVAEARAATSTRAERTAPKSAPPKSAPPKSVPPTSVPPTSSEPTSGPPAPRSSAPAAPVDSWDVVPIPSDDDVPPPDDEEPAPPPEEIAPSRAPAAPVSAGPSGAAAAPADDGSPEASAPARSRPAPSEPAAAPAPEAPARSTPVRPAASAPATRGGAQRYGEAVVREVLGATFLEEEQLRDPRSGVEGG